jgi:hypothetical protein
MAILDAAARKGATDTSCAASSRFIGQPLTRRPEWISLLS